MNGTKNLCSKDLLSLVQGLRKKNFPRVPVSCDSRTLKPGFVFVALQGHKDNGHHYLKQAIKKGAYALIVQDKDFLQGLNFKGPVFITQDTRLSLCEFLNHWYNFPSEKMFCVGVTGTNGKSTVSQMVAHIFASLGWKTGLIGTVDAGCLSPPTQAAKKALSSAGPSFERLKKSTLTTPDAITLYGLLDQFYKKHVQAVVMEVSSIGMDQKRVEGISFPLCVFTNLSEDHMDYHLNQEAYFKAKEKLFHRPGLNTSLTTHSMAVLNFEDPYGLQIARNRHLPCLSYSTTKGKSHFYSELLAADLHKTVFNLHYENQVYEVFLPLPGSYNVLNALAALCVAYGAGFNLKKATEALSSFSGVRGRLQLIPSPKKTAKPKVFVDYAHSPEALKSVLKFLRDQKKKGRLFVVFGCGGLRDKLKRPLMTQIAEKYSDRVFLTSDNPRTEDVKHIIQDCLKGVKNTQKKIVVEKDRKKAILLALTEGGESDIVLIAGKGHEKEQILGTKRIPFDDTQIALKALNQRAKKQGIF